MRRPRYGVIRILALLAIVASGFSVFAVPASAAPDTFSSGSAAAYQATGTVSGSAYICNGLEGVVWGGTPDGNCSATTTTFVFYLIGDGTDDNWSLNAPGSTSLPAGSYEVWENSYWTSGAVTIPAGGTGYVTVLYPGQPLPPPPPPPAQTGTVSAAVYVCNGLESVVWGGTPDANCTATSGTLYFYLIGDGTDENWALNAPGSRSLTAGSYEVWEGRSWTSGSVTIPAGGTGYVTILYPGNPMPPPPAKGTVTMNKYVCNGLSQVTWGGSPDANCSPSSATFYFYLIGDGTDEYWTLSVNGSGSRQLQPGTYEVYEGGAWSMSRVTVTAGQTTTLNVLNPGNPLPPPTPAQGTVSMSKYVCNGLDGIVWGGTPDANCSPSSATFYFYLIGDGTDDYWVLNVNGTGARQLPVGTYEVWEANTWTSSTVTVTADQITYVNVLNPGRPLPALGDVEISKYECDGISQVTWRGTPDANCDPGAATFYFYLIGDGTDQYWKLDVEGTDTITLKAGTYEVWEDGTWSMHKITVVEGQTVEINVLNPDD